MNRSLLPTLLPTSLRTLAAAWVLAAASAAPVALAGPITFEAAPPGTFVADGSTFGTYTEAGATFSVAGGFGAIDSVAAFGGGQPLDLPAPMASDGQFLSVLGDGRATMSLGGASFRLAGFSFAYLPPLANLFAAGAGSEALLLVDYFDAAGLAGQSQFDFGLADAGGAFAFQTLGLADMGALASGVSSVSFSACVIFGSQCVQASGGFSQFAIDNLVVSEPGSLTLAGLALALGCAVSGARRGRHPAAAA